THFNICELFYSDIVIDLLEGELSEQGEASPPKKKMTGTKVLFGLTIIHAVKLTKKDKQSHSQTIHVGPLWLGFELKIYKRLENIFVVGLAFDPHVSPRNPPNISKNGSYLKPIRTHAPRHLYLHNYYFNPLIYYSFLNK
ncbi:hypothetical protein ACJX0J_020685, partial [Zea mays]